MGFEDFLLVDKTPNAVNVISLHSGAYLLSPDINNNILDQFVVFSFVIIKVSIFLEMRDRLEFNEDSIFTPGVCCITSEVSSF